MVAAGAGRTGPGRGLKGHLLVLAAVLAAYATVFAIGYARSEDGFFHRYFDQVSYRHDAAEVAEVFAENGPLDGVASAWQHAGAQGVTYPLIGGIAYSLGIEPAHTVFAVFLVALALLWLAAAGGGRQPWLGWLALALICSSSTLLNRVGSLRDFRPDFLGQVGWTLATAIAMRSAGFRERGWSVALGLVLGATFCTRSLTLAHAAAALPACAAIAWCAGDRAGRRARLSNLGWATAIAALLAAPMFVSHLDRMWDYYVDNHISARENEARGFSGGFVDYLHRYWRSLRHDHLGWATTVLMIGTLVLTARGSSWRAWRPVWPMAATSVAFMSPLVVLAAGPQFSSTVIGVAVGSFTLLALVPGLAGGDPCPARPRLWLAVVVLGLLVWPVRFLYKCDRDHDQRIANGHHLVGRQHRAILEQTAGQTDVTISTLPLIEAHSLAMLELVGFERVGKLPERFAYGLGHQIYALESADEFEQAVRRSDVILWWDGGSSGGEMLPANREAAERRDLIARVLAEDFRQAAGDAGEIQLEGHPLRLYFRRASQTESGEKPDQGEDR